MVEDTVKALHNDGNLVKTFIQQPGWKDARHHFLFDNYRTEYCTCVCYVPHKTKIWTIYHICACGRAVCIHIHMYAYMYLPHWISLRNRIVLRPRHNHGTYPCTVSVQLLARKINCHPALEWEKEKKRRRKKKESRRQIKDDDREVIIMEEKKSL